MKGCRLSQKHSFNLSHVPFCRCVVNVPDAKAAGGGKKMRGEMVQIDTTNIMFIGSSGDAQSNVVWLYKHTDFALWQAPSPPG